MIEATVDLIPAAHLATHGDLKRDAARFVAETDRRHLCPENYTGGGQRMVSGACTTCNSNVTIILESNHPLVVATALRDQAKKHRDAAVFRDHEDDPEASALAEDLRELATTYERRAGEIEGQL